jgi:hypothetical protein
MLARLTSGPMVRPSRPYFGLTKTLNVVARRAPVDEYFGRSARKQQLADMTADLYR